MSEKSRLETCEKEIRWLYRAINVLQDKVEELEGADLRLEDRISSTEYEIGELDVKIIEIKRGNK